MVSEHETDIWISVGDVDNQKLNCHLDSHGIIHCVDGEEDNPLVGFTIRELGQFEKIFMTFQNHDINASPQG